MDPEPSPLKKIYIYTYPAPQHFMERGTKNPGKLGNRGNCDTKEECVSHHINVCAGGRAELICVLI